jgi:hypothetical protein
LDEPPGYPPLGTPGLVLRWLGPEPSAYPRPAGAVCGVRSDAGFVGPTWSTREMKKRKSQRIIMDNLDQFGSIWFISLLYAGHSLYFVGIFILRFWFASLKGPGDDRAVGMRC